MILEKIQSPEYVRTLGTAELKTLCAELRERILASVSKNGGHLSSNLGAVELTVAFHKAFSPPADKIVFDVGHQSYAHKLLTGRQAGFEKLRSDGGVSGFTKRSESDYDPFGSGHSGNAVSAAVGIASANRLNGNGDYTVALVGDGAFTNGMTYEALNNCTDSDLRLIILLNDNEMAISRNVGAIDNIFSRMRTSKRYFRFKNRVFRITSAIPLLGKPLIRALRAVKNFFKRIVLKENLFETLGFEYYGPVDGNDIDRLISVLEQAKRSDRVCVVHAYTRKGKGYPFAEQHPDSYHSVARFNVDDGIVPNGKEHTFSFNVGSVLAEKAAADRKICAVTAAMTGGTGLTDFAKRFPERFFDVGIAEEHAATFCAGLSTGGFKPVFAVYSTFMQRCFDQLAEDVAMQELDMTLLIDRAGIVCDDGITHHGVFDIPLLNQLPNACIYSPDSLSELDSCISNALSHKGLSAVRYPKGKEREYDRAVFTSTENLAYADFGDGKPTKTVVTYGVITSEAVKAAVAVGSTRLIKLIRVKPLDFDEILPLLGDTPVLFVEEGMLHGGIGEAFACSVPNRTVIKALNAFVAHGSEAALLRTAGLDAQSLADALRKL